MVSTTFPTRVHLETGWKNIFIRWYVTLFKTQDFSLLLLSQLLKYFDNRWGYSFLFVCFQILTEKLAILQRLFQCNCNMEKVFYCRVIEYYPGVIGGLVVHFNSPFAVISVHTNSQASVDFQLGSVLFHNETRYPPTNRRNESVGACLLSEFSKRHCH